MSDKPQRVIADVEREIAALRSGAGRSRQGTVTLLRDVLDGFMAAGFDEAKQAGCRCEKEDCKYPLCSANRA